MSVTQQFERFKSHFCKVLRLLCQEKGSINKVCRDTGINRQQFAKYMSGANIPSLFVVQKLADYFKISPNVFFLNDDGRTVQEYLAETSSSAAQISGYYLEYTDVATSRGPQVSVSVWRFYKRGSIVLSHGEVPYPDTSCDQKWFERYTGTVTENHRQLVMQASNVTNGEVSHAGAMWLFRPYAHGPSDLMAVKIQTEFTSNRSTIGSIAYFRSMGTDPNLTRIVLEECGIFEPKNLNLRASAIMQTIAAHRAILPTQLQLLGT